MKKVSKTKSKTVNDSNPMSSLRTKLKAANPEIQHYVSALEEENLKLHKKIGKLQAENVSLNSRITIAEEDTNERCFHENLPIECINEKIKQRSIRREQLENELKKIKTKR